ncbi:MAG: hypothetical protein AAGA85_21360 [Bacteroidota bacterium]
MGPQHIGSAITSALGFDRGMSRLVLVWVLLLTAVVKLWAQVDDVGAVKVLARANPDKILLRWAVDQPFAWQKGNEQGFLVVRYTISRNGQPVLPVERLILTPDTLRPSPLEQWEELATQDDNAAVIAEAIYGEDFEIAVGGGMGTILAVNEQLEQRFTFALVAADQSYEAALMAGWALVDDSVVDGEKYLYKINVALATDTPYSIGEGSAYVSLDQYEELPKPVGLVSAFADQNVMLNWNYSILQQTYTSYFVERSTDGSSYQQVNGRPIFNAQGDDDGREISMFFNDSITNDVTYYYRVRGVTSFGEIGPPSDVQSGQGKEVLDYTPRIVRKVILSEDSVALFWEFPEEGNEVISGFEIRRANRAEGPYGQVLGGISPTSRQAVFSGIQRVNYFTVVAIGNTGLQKPSFPALVQPIDSVPPTSPKGLQGVMDTTGVVRLGWTANPEPDLSGYRVFRASNANAEFSQLTVTPVGDNSFVDSISVRNLNQKIFYKIIAVDQRYNESDFSEVLSIEKPDLVPPSPAVFEGYETGDAGIELRWIPSSSADAMGHTIYRRQLVGGDGLWQGIVTIPTTEGTTNYLDTSIEPGRTYAYTVVARDKSGLESSPSNVLQIRSQRRMFADQIQRLTGTADRENRLIQLSWKAKEAKAVEFLIYRAEGGGGLKLYRKLDASYNSYADTNLSVNTTYVYGLQMVEQDGAMSQIKEVRVVY